MFQFEYPPPKKKIATFKISYTKHARHFIKQQKNQNPSFKICHKILM